MHDRGPVKTALLLGFCALGCTAQELRVYAIEVECGKATLYVSPSGESMLVDAGHAEALETARLVAAIQAARRRWFRPCGRKRQS